MARWKRLGSVGFIVAVTWWLHNPARENGKGTRFILPSRRRKGHGAKDTA
jgi:hypothetical protein